MGDDNEGAFQSHFFEGTLGELEDSALLDTLEALCSAGMIDRAAVLADDDPTAKTYLYDL